MNKKQMFDEIGKMEATLAKLKAELQKPEAPEPWKPEEDEDVHFVTGACYVYSTTYCDKADRELVKVGNCFPTKERAEQVAEKIRMLLKLEQLHDMFCPDYEPDWTDVNTPKYKVVWDYDLCRWSWVEFFNMKFSTAVCFDNFDTVEKVVDILNKEEYNSECK